MNRQERVTQRRDREEKEGIYIYTQREREYLYTFVIILNWLYTLRVFFSIAGTGFNEASFSWCIDEL